MAPEAVIATRDLHVEFRSRRGRVEALQGVDMTVPRGALFVLLGPNGAGKTTLLRCITGLVRPTRGEISVFGAVARAGTPAGASREGLRRMGVLIENPGTYARLDAREYLTFFGSFYGVPDLPSRILSLCGELGLEPDGRPIGKLSQGNRQKLQLIRSLLHAPDLLLWDEPTDHLDPASQREVLRYLRSYLAGTGATALVATHRLEQMEAAATHFGFIGRGKLVRAGDRRAILGAGALGIPSDRPGEDRARIGFTRAVFPEELASLAAEFRVGFSGAPAEAAEMEGWEGKAEVTGQDLRARMPELVKALCLRGFPVAAVEWRGPGLAEAYARILEA